MADILDEHGNPIELTDEHGRKVQLTDEHGVPVHLTGVATTVDSGHHAGTTIGSDPVVGSEVEKEVPCSEPQPPLSHLVTGAEGRKQLVGPAAGSSSSSSSEEDGEGGRRKKKGFMQKIKEKLPGHKNKEEQTPEKVYTATTKISVTTPAGPPGEPKRPEFVQVEHHEEEHEKKHGFIDKIKDKLPGHRAH